MEIISNGVVIRKNNKLNYYIHKSQGSEYPAVIIPITMQSYRMLKRNLIYTAITRAKKLVVIIGEKKALSIAVRNTKGLERYSKLKDWLMTGVEK